MEVKKSIIDAGFVYRLAWTFVTQTLPFIGTFVLWMYLYQEFGFVDTSMIISGLMVSLLLFLLFDSFEKRWLALIVNLSLLVFLIGVATQFTDVEMARMSPFYFLAGTFIAVRSIAYALVVMRVRYTKLVSDILLMSMQVVWAIGAFVILNRDLPGVFKTVIPLTEITVDAPAPTIYLFTNLVFVGISFNLAFLILTWRNSQLTQFGRKLRRLGSWGMGEEIVDAYLTQPKQLQLTPEIRGILFGDIRGFTRFSEENSVITVLEVLDRMYSEVEEIVAEHSGAKPEFIADEFITYFDSAIDSVNCAVELNNRVNGMLYEYELSMGMGLDYGQVLEGAVGGSDSKKYTVLGRRVNTASRLQSEARGQEILISDAVLKQIPELKVTQIHDLNLKGVVNGFAIYSVDTEQQKFTKQEIDFWDKMRIWWAGSRLQQFIESILALRQR